MKTTVIIKITDENKRTYNIKHTFEHVTVSISRLQTYISFSANTKTMSEKALALIMNTNNKMEVELKVDDIRYAYSTTYNIHSYEPKLSAGEIKISAFC